MKKPQYYRPIDFDLSPKPVMEEKDKTVTIVRCGSCKEEFKFCDPALGSLRGPYKCVKCEMGNK